MKTTSCIRLIIILSMILGIASCKKEKTSPSDTLLAFTSTADHNYGEIYLCKVNGSNLERVSELSTKSLSDAEYFPEFSLDGKLIKFRGFDYTLKVYDFNTRQLTPIDKVWTSTWMGSNEVVYIQQGLDNQLFKYSSDGTKNQLTFYESWRAGPEDTTLSFQGLGWDESSGMLISGGVYKDVKHLVKVDPKTGRVSDMYPLNLGIEFTITASKVVWTQGDSIYIHNLAKKETKQFMVKGLQPLNAIMNPEGSRIAFTTRYNDEGTQQRFTDIVTCNLSGLGKRRITANNDINDSWKYGAVFTPCWNGNKEILFSAGNIFSVTDEESPKVTTLVSGVKAGGQLHKF